MLIDRNVSRPGGWLNRIDPLYPIGACLIVAFFAAPLLLSLIVCLTCVIVANRRLIWLFLAAACVMFTLLNATKELTGDLANYVALQHYIRYIGFEGLFDRDVIAPITGSYRVTEIGFYGPMWILSKLFDNQRLVVAAVATLGIYVPTFLGLVKIARREQWSVELLLVVALFAFFAAINFVQTTHLLRQYIATSLIFFAFARFLEGRRASAALFALAGCSVHNAAAILVADVIVLAFLFPYTAERRFNLFSVAWRLLVAGLVLGGSLAAVSLLELQQFALDESPISVWHFVIVAVFFGAFVLLASHGAVPRQYVHYSKQVFCIVFTLSLGFFIIGIRLFALRYLAYLEWVFGPMLGGILHSMPRERLGRYFFSRWAVIALTVMIFVMRVHGAPWTYGGQHAEILATSYFELIPALGE